MNTCFPLFTFRRPALSAFSIVRLAVHWQCGERETLAAVQMDLIIPERRAKSGQVTSGFWDST